MSAKYNFDKQELKGVGKVVIYTAVSSALGVIAMYLLKVETASAGTFLALIVPSINTVIYAIQKFLENKTKEIESSK